MFSAPWFEVLTSGRRTSFSHWLIGLGLMILAGLLLYALGSPKPDVARNHMAKADNCLQAAGSDLKRGELVYHDMNVRPCGCTAAN